MVAKNKTLTFILTTFLIVISFVLYQYFFSGFTKLHNPAKAPNVVISDVVVDNNMLTFQGYNKGGETGYVVLVNVTDGTNEITIDAPELGSYSQDLIENQNINNVKGNKFSLQFPRGGKANIQIQLPEGFNKDNLQFTLNDVSGKVSQYPLTDK